MIIDPPSVFAPLIEWVAFRREMEELVSKYPNESDPAEWLKIAEDKEAELRNAG